MNVQTKTFIDGADHGNTASINKKRRNIWEIQCLYHFSIISLCLTSYERKKLLFPLVGQNSENCHLKIIQSLLTKIQKKCHCSANAQGILDKKFKIHIDRLSGLGEPELQSFWQRWKEKPDMNGVYWALMSHSATGYSLRNRIFQEVSIASYQSCCKLLSVQKKHEILKDEVTNKNQKLSLLEQEVKKKKCIYCNQIVELEQELSVAKYEIDRLQRHLSLYTGK